MARARGSRSSTRGARRPAHREPNPKRKTYRDEHGHFISKAEYDRLRVKAARARERARERARLEAERRAAEAREAARRERRNALARARRAAERKAREEEARRKAAREEAARQRRNAAARARRAEERRVREEKERKRREAAERRRQEAERQRQIAEAERAERERAAALAGAEARRRELAAKAEAERLAAEERARAEAEREAAIIAEIERERAAEIKREREAAAACKVESREAKRSKLPKDRQGVEKLPREKALTRIEHIEQVLADACVCIREMGYKVGQPVSWHYPDGSFDAELKFDPGGSAAEALLDVGATCIKPVRNAWFVIQTRWLPNEYIENEIEKMKRDAKTEDEEEAHVPAYLVLLYNGMIQRSINYGKADLQSQINDRLGVMADLCDRFETVYERPQAKEIVIRYFFTPDLDRPPNPDSTGWWGRGRRRGR